MKKVWNASRACALVNKLLYAALCHRHRKRLFACVQFLQKAHFLLPVLDGHRTDFFQVVAKSRRVTRGDPVVALGECEQCNRTGPASLGGPQLTNLRAL